MTRLPTLTRSRIIKALQKSGFQIKRQRESHVYLQHQDGRATVVPFHQGEDIGRGLLRKILRDAKIEPEDFEDLL